MAHRNHFEERKSEVGLDQYETRYVCQFRLLLSMIFPKPVFNIAAA